MATEYERPAFASTVYRHALAVRKDDGSVIFQVPERLPFEDRDDTTIHVGSGQEYLWDLALLYYKRSRIDAVDLWEVIADFQPEPIVDRSIPIAVGQIVLVPSEEYIEEVLDGPPLSDTPEL